MKHPLWIRGLALALLVTSLLSLPASAQDKAGVVPEKDIAQLQTQLDEAGQAKSSARKKLALRRVIRQVESMLKDHADAPNYYELVGVLFRSQQALVKVDDSATNRKAFLETARRLAEAPNEFAAIRLDADLLLSQAELAKQGADLRTRGEALRPLIERYRDTEVEVKVVRIAMIMALEFGDTRLIAHLREVIAQRFPGNADMINFQRDKLAGQVFGAPFVGLFERSDGKMTRLPMDGLGKTTALYFWTKEGDGLEQLKLLAEGWKAVQANPETNASGRYQFISFNLDGLPDAGESLLREAGLDWPALHLPGGEDSEIYKTYVRNTPKLLTMTPTGYTAMVMSGSTRVRPDRGWERSFGSMFARSWSNDLYCTHMQSILSGDFLVIDAAGSFDPTSPPEWKAAQTTGEIQPLKRTANSVPEEKLRAIQACFVKPPMRYGLNQEQARAMYQKAETLCSQAIAAHPDADDLWIVRNRRIIALMGLWKVDGKREHFDAALKESNLALEAGYPAGTDVVAKFCVTRQALRAKDAKPAEIIKAFATSEGGTAPATTHALASLLALDIADRPLHEHYRKLSLDKHADHPVLWTATAFLLDRYHRYWMYHPPFTAGWTYGRRMGHFLAIGEPEDANRKLDIELKTLDGSVVRIPEDTAGKWSVIEFARSAEGNRHLQRYGTFVETRPFEDVVLYSAILDDDAEAARKFQEEKKRPENFPTLLVPGGMDHPVVSQLGILSEDQRPNIAIIRPDGSIAAMVSGLTMRSQNGNVFQNIVQWHDEQAVDQALERGDLEEAKRLAFAHAPLPEPVDPNAKKKPKPKTISPPHLRSRAKVYMAMNKWQLAYDDIHAAYLAVNSRAGWLSMRTKDLDETERLRDLVIAALEQAKATK